MAKIKSENNQCQQQLKNDHLEEIYFFSTVPQTNKKIKMNT